VLTKILSYGAIAGAIVGAMLIAVHFAFGGNPPDYGMLIGYATMLIALSTVFVAIKRQRDNEGGGVIRFWPALGLGLGISLVAGILYALCWEVVLAMTPGGADGFIDTLVANAEARAATPEAAARAAEEFEGMREIYRNPLIRLPISFAEFFPVGLLVSLVSAALLRNPRFLPVR